MRWGSARGSCVPPAPLHVCPGQHGMHLAPLFPPSSLGMCCGLGQILLQMQRWGSAPQVQWASLALWARGPVGQAASHAGSPACPQPAPGLPVPPPLAIRRGFSGGKRLRERIGVAPGFVRAGGHRWVRLLPGRIRGTIAARRAGDAPGQDPTMASGCGGTESAASGHLAPRPRRPPPPWVSPSRRAGCCALCVCVCVRTCVRARLRQSSRPGECCQCNLGPPLGPARAERASPGRRGRAAAGDITSR